MFENSDTDCEDVILAQYKNVNYVLGMFDRISPFYDRMNRFISWGFDANWRRAALRAAALPKGGYLLDVGTGTGDMSVIAAQSDAKLCVTGLDFCQEMLRVGQIRLNGAKVNLTAGDGLCLPCPDNTFDASTSVFFMRNLFIVHGVEGVLAAFAEQRRVVRTGGRVVCLEFSRPEFLPFRWGSFVYVNYVIPAVAGTLCRQWATYRYLGWSISQFLPAQAVTQAMQAAGLRQINCRRLMLGNVTLHVGIKGD